MLAGCEDDSIAYDDNSGASLPVVFVHGFPHDRTLWAPQTAALAGQARCLALDLPGFGESTLGGGRDGATSVDHYADAVVCVLDAAMVERAVVVGLSMGGYIAFALWRRHRDRVRALVLVSTRATPDSDEVRAKRAALIDTAHRDGSGAVADTQIVGALSRRTRENKPDLVRTVHAMQAGASVPGIVGALGAMIARPDSTPDLATITVPTLVMAGRDDVLIRPNEARAMQQAVPGSRIEILGEAGHLCNVESPTAFNDALGDFLTSIAAA